MSPQHDLGDPLHIAYQRTGCNIRLQQSVHSSPVGSSDRKQRFLSDRKLLHPPHKAAGVVGGSAGERLLAANLWLPWHEATRGRGTRTMHAGSAALRARTSAVTGPPKKRSPLANRPFGGSVCTALLFGFVESFGRLFVQDKSEQGFDPLPVIIRQFSSPILSV